MGNRNNEVGKRGTIPRAPNHHGRAEKAQQCHKYFLQYSTFASERPQVWTWGRQTCLLSRAPSNLVTSLAWGAKKRFKKLYIKISIFAKQFLRPRQSDAHGTCHACHTLDTPLSSSIEFFFKSKIIQSQREQWITRNILYQVLECGHWHLPSSMIQGYKHARAHICLAVCTFDSVIFSTNLF